MIHAINAMRKSVNAETKMFAPTKICYACRVEQPRAEFHRDNTAQGGVIATCRTCIKARKETKKEKDHAKKLKQREQRAALKG